MNLLTDLFFDYTLRTVALGAVLLGAVSGVLGSFALLRRQSLLGDAISHAALPGVVLAFLITRSKSPLVLLLGALAAGWLGVLIMQFLQRRTRISQDSALGLVLSVFFGFGMMLLTFTQSLPDARQAGLNKFLFGQAATLLTSDVLVMAGLTALALLLVALFWKEFKLVSFDAEYAASLGLPSGRLDLLLNALLVVAIVTGLQAVGVVLMSALVVAPAAAARQWTDRLSVMAGLAAGFGALAGLSGALASAAIPGLPTGPAVVLAAGTLVLFSMLFAPNRGLVSAAVRRVRQARESAPELLALELLRIGGQHADPYRPHAVAVLRTASSHPAGVAAALQELARRGWVTQVTDQGWALTPVGLQAAQSLQKNGSSMEGSEA